jgi:hypothetical protein
MSFTIPKHTEESVKWSLVCILLLARETKAVLKKGSPYSSLNLMIATALFFCQRTATNKLRTVPRNRRIHSRCVVRIIQSRP